MSQKQGVGALSNVSTLSLDCGIQQLILIFRIGVIFGDYSNSTVANTYLRQFGKSEVYLITWLAASLIASNSLVLSSVFVTSCSSFDYKRQNDIQDILIQVQHIHHCKIDKVLLSFPSWSHIPLNGRVAIRS